MLSVIFVDDVTVDDRRFPSNDDVEPAASLSVMLLVLCVLRFSEGVVEGEEVVVSVCTVAFAATLE